MLGLGLMAPTTAGVRRDAAARRAWCVPIGWRPPGNGARAAPPAPTAISGRPVALDWSEGPPRTMSINSITLSDEEGVRGERAPSRRSARQLGRWGGPSMPCWNGRSVPWAWL